MTPFGVDSLNYGFGATAGPKQPHGSKYVTVTTDDVRLDGDAVKDYCTAATPSQGSAIVPTSTLENDDSRFACQ